MKEFLSYMKKQCDKEKMQEECGGIFEVVEFVQSMYKTWKMEQGQMQQAVKA